MTERKATVDWQRGMIRKTERGRLALRALDPGFLIVQFRGHGDRAFFEPLVAGLERALELATSVQIFVDSGAER